MQSILKTLVIVFAMSGLSGCGTMHKAIKHGKLDVQTRMSETVFLEPVEDNKRTVVLQIRNTSDKKDLQIEEELKQAIEAKGYRVVRNPSEANFMIQANILQVGKNTLEDPFGSLTGGYGGALDGALLGGLAGGLATDSFGGAGVGALVGGIGGTIADAMVEVVNYSMITDLQISEKASGHVVNEASNASLKQGTSGHKTSSWSEKSNWKKYQTRIISSAKKTNLKFETALPELKQGLIQSISGLL